CSIDRNSAMSPARNAQVSTTCWPNVLITRTAWPRTRRAALPRRAGISISTRPSVFLRRPFHAEIGEAGIERRRPASTRSGPHGATLAGRDHRGVFGAARCLARGKPPALHVTRPELGRLAQLENVAAR